VTHDRIEAMAMGDEVAVMIDGRIRQVGAVGDVFQRPRDGDVARALGVETVLDALVERTAGGLATLRVASVELSAVAGNEGRSAAGDRVLACIRAEDVTLERLAAGDSARNHLAAVVTAIEREGAVDRVTLDCGFTLVAVITARSREELALEPGTRIIAAVKATAIHIVARP
jgi:molybdate transport system ATP-binding protein